jgi:flavorubredoxin
MDDFVTQVEAFAAGKTIGLFGSYDWGDGEWMRQWTDRMVAAGATVVNGEGVTANLAPEEDALEACRALGAALAK